MKKFLLASVFALAGAFGAHAADFGGVYVGGNVDYSTQKVEGTHANGVSGGLIAGYGVELNKFYVGGELEGGLSSASKDTDAGRFKQKDYYGAAAKLGYKVTDKVLAYGLIGVEGGDFKLDGDSANVYGMRYGAGVETFVRRNITVGGQVDYVDWNRGLGGNWKIGTDVAYHF